MARARRFVARRDLDPGGGTPIELREWRGWWPDLAVGLVFLAAVGLLPVALGGYVHGGTFAGYGLFLRELVGEAGVLPLETPKPLTTLRTAFGEPTFYWLGALGFALAPAFLGRFSERVHGTRAVGVGGVAAALLGSAYLLPGPLLSAYWPLTYLGLAALALWAFAEGRYGACLGAVALAGLVRPDAWGYAVAILMLVYLGDRDAWRPGYLAALLPVPAWLLFDLALTGDPLYSLGTTETYRALMGVAPATLDTFWSGLLPDVADAYVAPVLVAGVLGLALSVARAEGRTRRRGHGLAAVLVLLPFAGYWALSGLGEGLVLHVRFFVLPLLLLHCYALALPVEALRWWTEARSSRRARPWPRHAVAVAAAAGAIGLGWVEKEPWSTTVARHEVSLAQRETRAAAVEVLRERWVEGGTALLTGRSLEVFAHRLGPDAARRMIRFREAATYPDRLRASPVGTAVYVGGDTAGRGARFRFLRRVRAVEVPELGLRFEPLVVLRHRGRTAGAIYRYGPSDP